MERLTYHSKLGLTNRRGTEQEVIDRLAELEDKLESGQLVELPWKIGEKVYLVRRNRNLKWVVSRTTVTMYLKHNRLLVKCACDSEWNDPQDIFTDKSQAEARLKELQEQKNV